MIVWTMRSPYVFVGGRLEAEGSGAKFAISWDGKSWQEVGRDLDEFFPPAGRRATRYYLQCELSGGARLKRLAIANDLQMAPLTLPGMGVGKNTFIYTDQSPGGRQVRITHDWVERSASPTARRAAGAVFPPDGGEAEGTDVVFQWQPAARSRRRRDRRLPLRALGRADMKWPLSMNFCQADLANRRRAARPSTRCRARPAEPRPRNTTGTSGRKTTRASGARGARPGASRREGRRRRRTSRSSSTRAQPGILRWTPNPLGRKPAKYRVYGSDEKGFSVSDEPYEVTVGHLGKAVREVPRQFRRRDVGHRAGGGGSGLELAGANKAFYRVVAVDAAGNRSGPPITLRRPGRSSPAPPVTEPGRRAYRYQLAAIRSLGDLDDPGRGRQGNDELLGHRTASLRASIADRSGSRSTKRPGCSPGTPDRSGNDRRGCQSGTRTRRSPPGRRGPQMGGREGHCDKHRENRDRNRGFTIDVAISTSGTSTTP